jgi:hypothetical protein
MANKGEELANRKKKKDQIDEGKIRSTYFSMRREKKKRKKREEEAIKAPLYLYHVQVPYHQKELEE